MPSETDNLRLPIAIQVMRALDNVLPRVRLVAVRGLEVASELLATPQFRERSAVYLTDFYSLAPSGRVTSEAQRRAVAVCVWNARHVLVQTDEIAAELHQLSGVDFKELSLPPVIPEILPHYAASTWAGRTVRIGYAGKINPNWGVTELLDWAKRLRALGVKAELEIVANKISNFGDIRQRMSEPGVHHQSNLNRSEAMEVMARVGISSGAIGRPRWKRALLSFQPSLWKWSLRAHAAFAIPTR